MREAPVSIDPLLLVVDMQRVFQHPDSPWATPGFDELRSPIDELAAAFADRVVFSRFVLPAEATGSWGPYYDMWQAVTAPERADWFELADPWRSEGVHTLDRPTFSKWGPELSRQVGPDRTLVLCGVATDCCVIATALAAVDDGIFVRVVADACRGATGEAHRRAVELMAGFGPRSR